MPRRRSHPGTIERRSGSYRVILQVKGERHTFTLKDERSYEKAAAFARRKYDEIRRRIEVGLPTGAVPLAEVFDRFEEDKVPQKAPSTQRAYRQSLGAFRRFFLEESHGMPAAAGQIHAGHIQAYLSWRRETPLRGTKTPVSSRTLAKDRAVLHSVFQHALRLKLVDANPVAATEMPRSDGRDPVILNEEQFEKLLKAAKGPMLTRYILVLGETGMRTQEALRLKWEDVDLQEGFLWVASRGGAERTKSGKGRWVPMSPRLHEAMRDHFADFRMKLYQGERSEWVFHHPVERRRARAGERYRTLLRGFKAAADRAKLPAELVQHDLRHRAVTRWLAEGKNPVHVKEAVGHSDLRVTMGYTHLAREHLRPLVDPPPAVGQLTERA